jgi:hypothetical protein
LPLQTLILTQINSLNPERVRNPNSSLRIASIAIQ